MQQSNGGEQIPSHIAIILDGNGRWAKRRGLPRTMGHRQGAKAVEPIIRRCLELGVSSLSLYAFSTENWSRPASEVDAIMNLLREMLHSADQYRRENVRLRVIGDRSALAPDLLREIESAERESAGRTGMTVNMAINYGGREEIARAARLLAEQVKDGTLSPEEIGEKQVAAALYTAGQPELDLLIRPSGEKRISNFLLWQCAYAEFVFMDILWPDFTPADLDAAIEEYRRRHRRFGGI
ncbi:MAG: isoprenyl transferase [Oscillospiraceae bacterium]|mgnify:FL=1|nr:isoprenyl transferase [Oscillospiraceae bacterium]MCM0704696.1 isoprenyl transferase [Faecalicatena sp. BF-R-105]MDY3218442.1 isoprenyl transferase [Candidatus Fimivivens sp.]SFJ44128.1 undecaprenyl diphosphate synthase [Ruminococcaceae bacterium D5]GKH49685.1 isoprenyl transferase [Eubacteriales bacterium]